jgi:hypothetical protein
VTVEPRSDIARRPAAGQLATDAPANPWAHVGLLKPYAHGVAHERPRMDALAVVSAGYKAEKNGRSYPVVSRDGTILIKDDGNRAPGLAKELARRGGKSLTIAVVSNDPGDVLQQHFAYRSATRLMAHGDAEGVTVINVRDEKDENGKLVPVVERKHHAAGTATYNAAVEKCKVESNFYFVLARWGDDGQPKLIFPDGLGFYRLRFTSLNSAENIRSQLAYIASLPITQGRIAGIPLELAIDYREVSGPDGSRRRVPVWTLVLRPPSTIELDVVQTARILESGMAQARGLALPLPTVETFEAAEREGADLDLDRAVIDGDAREVSPSEVRHLGGGGKVDPDWLIRNYFAGAGRTSLRDDDGREAFLLAYTGGRTGSLREFAETANRHESEAFLKALADRVGIEIAASNEDDARTKFAEYARAQGAPTESQGRSYQQLFGDDDDDAPPQAAAPVASEPFVVPPEVHAAAILTGAPLQETDHRGYLLNDLRELVERAKAQGATIDLPDDLEAQDTATLETLHDSILGALEANAATSGATLA